jgi:hypothetical protein
VGSSGQGRPRGRQGEAMNARTFLWLVVAVLIFLAVTKTPIGGH